MSHFSVAVFSKENQNIEDLLAKYDENIVVPKYLELTKEEIIKQEKENIEYYKNTVYSEYLKDKELYILNVKNQNHIYYLENEFPKKLTKTDEEIYIDYVENYGIETVFDEFGNKWSEYNPNSKWDWYVVGGRWSDFLNLKNGETADSAKIRDVNFDFDVNVYQLNLRFWELYVDGELPSTREDEKLLEGFNYKKEYYENLYDNKHDFAEENASFKTYALVTPEGEWIEPGKMHMFAVSDQTKESRKEYIEKLKELIEKGIDEDWYITIVDCHI